jgi:phage-related protein
MDEPTLWIFYVSRMGRAVVRDELRKMNLSQREQHSIEVTLRRIASGAPTRGDIDYLGRNVWEVRVRLERRILRLLYFTEMNPRLYVVVLAVIKKTQKTPPGWINIALARKAQWDSIDFSEAPQ